MALGAADMATVTADVYQPPAAAGGRVGSPVLFLSGRTVTPLQPLQPDDQLYTIDSKRRRRQAFMFATDASDWATVQTIEAGMELHIGSDVHQIRHVDHWDYGDHRYVRLVLELSVVAA